MNMMRILYEDVIPRPPEIVFPWIADPDKAIQWQKNVKGGEIIETRPEIIGTTFKEVIEEGGNRLEMQGKITKYVRNKTIAFHMKSRIHEFDVSYTVEGVGSATKISIDATIDWRFPMNVMSLFMRKKMEEGLRRQMESEVQELKTLCISA
jgi:uncharacterized protein YndB with AHSA1/START domain